MFFYKIYLQWIYYTLFFYRTLFLRICQWTPPKGVWVRKAYHPQTPLQWHDVSKPMFKLSQVVNVNTPHGRYMVVNMIHTTHPYMGSDKTCNMLTIRLTIKTPLTLLFQWVSRTFGYFTYTQLISIRYWHYTS